MHIFIHTYKSFYKQPVGYKPLCCYGSPYIIVEAQLFFSDPKDTSHIVHLSSLCHIPAQANESVELLGAEHSSDQCHMMQEVCQHFSSSSFAIGRGL